MAPARFLPFTLLVLAVIACAVVVESAPPGVYRIAHTRFVRRNFHQPPSDDQESGGVVSVRHKAPPLAFMYDEDLIRFVQCQYDPSLADCDETTEEKDDDEGAAANAMTPELGSQEQSSGEVIDGDEGMADQTAIDKMIQGDGEEGDDDYSTMLDDSIVEYINKHLDPTTD